MNRSGVGFALGGLLIALATVFLGVAAVTHEKDAPLFADRWLLSGLACAVLGLLIALPPAVVVAGSVISRSRSPLTAAFDAGDPFCYQRRERIEVPDIQLRIRVRNISRHGLTGMRASFVDLPTRYRHYVRIMHDNDRYCQRSSAGVDCTPKSVVYFDVVYCVIGDTQVFYQYADDDLIDTQYEEPVPFQTQEFEIEFLARWSDDNASVKPLRMRYRLERVGADDLTLVELKNGQPVPGSRNTLSTFGHTSPTAAQVTAAISKNRADYASRRASRHR